jgi:hypothetical protein
MKGASVFLWSTVVLMTCAGLMASARAAAKLAANTPTAPGTPMTPPMVPSMTPIPAALSPTPPTGSTPTPWSPPLVTSWQWQLSAPPTVNQLLRVQMYDVDGFDAPASLVTAMHAQNTRAVCYIDAGTWENWRPDAASFPASVRGANNGWRGERWLDIRQLAILEPIMTTRFQMCKDKGFDAVEPDNIDGYSNKTGFALTGQDQLTYNRWIAETVHALGLSVALKNDADQGGDLLSSFDFVIDEQCFEFSGCDQLLPFIHANKAVFEVEYNLDPSQFCSRANARNFNSLKKDLALDATRTACR